jgi:hypothetical protein
MNSKISALLVVLLFLVSYSNAQEKTKKELKEEKKLALQKEVEMLVNTKEFVFIGQTAFPIGYKTVNLNANSNYVKFYPDQIDCYMPFFGKNYGYATGGVNSTDVGIKFIGKPTNYTVTTSKKNHVITATVEDANDTYTINVHVGFDGASTLSIQCTNRSNISYGGQIYPLPTSEEPK